MKLQTHLMLEAGFKGLLSLAAAFCLTAIGPSAANANDLSNGNLDIIGNTTQNNPCPIGWVVDASKTISGAYADGGDSEPWCNVADTGGYGFFFKPFSGNQPAGDLLNVLLYQDNPCTAGTKITLSGYAAGEASYSGFFNTNTPPPQTLFFVEFLDGSGTPILTNNFDLIAAGLPNGGSGAMAQFTTPQYTAPSGTATVRAGAAIYNTYSTSGSQSFFVDAFDEESVPPPGSPVINTQPVSVTVAPNGNTTLTVAATGATDYQWQLNGADISNTGEFTGANLATLHINGATIADVGNYRVRVSNSLGALFSTTVKVALQDIAFYPTIVLTGKVGDTYRVDYSTALSPTDWIPMATNKLTTQPQYFIDAGSAGQNKRFYRSVFLY